MTNFLHRWVRTQDALAQLVIGIWCAPLVGLLVAGLLHYSAEAALTPARAWVLVVIVGADGEYEVWPGATYFLLGRDAQSFATEPLCATARAQALARSREPDFYTTRHLSGIGGGYTLSEYYRPVLITCLPIHDPTPEPQ